MAPTPVEDDPSLGEVIESATTRFLAECPHTRLQDPPSLGSFVKIASRLRRTGDTAFSTQDLKDIRRSEPAETEIPEFDDPFLDPPPMIPRSSSVPFPEGTLYGLVCDAVTGSIEPGRRAAAYGMDEDELRAEQPQIFDLLATRFSALHVAYVEGGRVRIGVPPAPPRIHARVVACTPEEVCAITNSPDLLRIILSQGQGPLGDELIVATLRQAYLCQNRDFRFLVRMGKQTASLMRDDPERVSALLRKLEPSLLESQA